LKFLFSYLLARSVRERDGSIDRTAVALEMAPGLDPSTQRDRLRKTLHALRVALGSDLKRLIHVTSAQVRFDLSEADLDVHELSQLSAKLNRRHGLLDAELAEEVRTLLEATAGGEFLSGFSDLEYDVTEARGDAGRIVADDRQRIAGWRADLTASLARYLEAAGRPQSSIAYLRSALSQSPDREDLARLLLAAYLQTGQTARADEVRAEYKLSLGDEK
jgi:two-component SAPR family response regulator